MSFIEEAQKIQQDIVELVMFSYRIKESIDPIAQKEKKIPILWEKKQREKFQELDLFLDEKDVKKHFPFVCDIKRLKDRSKLHKPLEGELLEVEREMVELTRMMQNKYGEKADPKHGYEGTLMFVSEVLCEF